MRLQFSIHSNLQFEALCTDLMCFCTVMIVSEFQPLFLYSYLCMSMVILLKVSMVSNVSFKNYSLLNIEMLNVFKFEALISLLGDQKK